MRKCHKCPFLHHFGPVLPNLGQIGLFSKKSLHHLKRVMVFYLYAKNYKKRSNGSKDITIRRIELSDWSRGEMPISREPDFSQTCGFRRMIENHNIFRFKPFLVTSNDSIFHKSPKKTILGTFGQIWAKPDFFPKNRALSLFCVYGPLTSCKISEKTNEPILRKVRQWLK